MSLYENINKRKRAGTSRSKSNSTISDKNYANMERGFKMYGGRVNLNRSFNKNFKRKEVSQEQKLEHGGMPFMGYKAASIKESWKLSRKFKKLPRAKYGLMDDKEVKDNPYSQSNPADRNPQYQLNRFIVKYVMPEYGGTIEGWKQILNEISYHESGPHQRFDSDMAQRGGGPGRGLGSTEPNSAKTAIKRLFGSSTDDTGNYHHRYEKYYDSYIKNKNPQFKTQRGDTITHTEFPELEKLYLSMVDVKLDDEGNMKGWKGDQSPFDVRQLSDESQGILMLMELMGNYEKADNPDLKLSSYFEGDQLADNTTRSELWGKYYNTNISNHKRRLFLKDINDFSSYDDEKGIETKWSWKDGYGGDRTKNAPVVNYAPFYSTPEDIIDLDMITNNLKESFDKKFGKGFLDDLTFEEITSPNVMQKARMDNTYVHPNTKSIDINRYNKQEKTD
tara:strand:- start:1329 stop:2672 length:1344 start_codon:yes stop_codon:yes gene_type:complete